jgi:molybdopterin-synthase adenylyltransferase
MPMREDQIVRYSRQILLRGIGGRGQERLLATSVAVGSGGAAIGTAVAYLAASGVAVLPANLPVTPSETGFLIAAADAGSSAADTLGRAIHEANEDAMRPLRSSFWLVEAPAAIPETPLAGVLIGGTGAGAAIVFGTSEEDGEVLRLDAPSRPVPLELADEAGALAALIIQCWAVGIGRAAGRVEVDSHGVARLVLER